MSSILLMVIYDYELGFMANNLLIDYESLDLI